MSDVDKNRTVIGPDCHLRGELWLENDLLMMGEVDGTLQVIGLLEMPAGAKAIGQIMCVTLRLAGRVEAEVLAESGVELLPGAFLSGKLYTPRLLVHEGATLQADTCVGPHALERARQLQELLSPTPDQACPNEASTIPGEPIQPPPPLPPISADAFTDPLRGEPVVSTVQTLPQTLRSTLEKPRLPRILKGGMGGSGSLVPLPASSPESAAADRPPSPSR